MFETKKTAGDQGNLSTVDDGLASHTGRGGGGGGITILQTPVFSKVHQLV